MTERTNWFCAEQLTDTIRRIWEPKICLQHDHAPAAGSRYFRAYGGHGAPMSRARARMRMIASSYLDASA